MGWFRRSRELARDTDPLASWGERIVKVVWPLVGPFVVPAVTGLLLGGAAWFTEYPLNAALVGLAAWAVMQVAFTARVMRKNAIRGSAVREEPSAESQPESTAPQPSPAEDSPGPLGIPQYMIVQRHIRYHPSPIRLVDLLEVVGENGVLRDFTFEHCILEGPGIINLGGPFPKPETTSSGPRGSLTVGPSSCRVEGSPDTVLYEITPGGKIPIGVIHLAGYTIRDVTFRGLGFAGTPDELQWLRKHLTFSEGNAVPAPPSINTAPSQRESQPSVEALKQRCRELADKLFQFLEDRGHGEMDDPDDPEMVRRSDETVGLYRRRFMGKVDALREDVEQRGLWGSGVLDPFGRDRAANPRNYLDIRAIAQHLSTIGHRS